MTRPQGELIPVLDQIEQDKGIKKQDLIKMIESALASAFRKHSGYAGNLETKIDLETGEIKAYLIKKVVETVKNPGEEITLSDARVYDNQIQLNTDVQVPIATEEFSRMAAQTAKQVIIQKIREIEKDNLFQEYKRKENTLLSGTVNRIINENIIIDLIRAEAILPLREQIPGERINIGDRIRVIELKVDKGARGPQILVSRSHPELIRLLFKQEVPEIADHTIEIVTIAREPGLRSKVAVRSLNPRVDPVGTCVGFRGARIRTILDELKQEKIDLVPWKEDPSQYITASLTPAKILNTKVVSPETRRVEVTVSDDQLALAIGRNGQNVRLASRLTGWYIDIKSESWRKREQEKKMLITNAEIKDIPGIKESLIPTLKEAGFDTVPKLAQAKIDQLTELKGIGDKTAPKLIQSAIDYLNLLMAKFTGSGTNQTKLNVPTSEPKPEPTPSPKPENIVSANEGQDKTE